MNFIKQILFRIFGVKVYLYIVSKLFFWSYFTGILKGNTTYDCHYLVKKLINKGDYVIDLGANLGYYSLIFSKLVGKKGKVFSIEPVYLYRTILSGNIHVRRNVEIIPYAIGVNDNEIIKMGVPVTSSYFRHGRTHVLTEKEDCSMTFEATIKRPDSIFKDLKKLNYMKCDIEGYENIAIPLFKNLLERFKPVLQIEIALENRAELFKFFTYLNYSFYEVKEEKLYSINETFTKTEGDLIFIPNEKLNQFTNLIAV